MGTRRKGTKTTKEPPEQIRQDPATTPAGREQQLAALAYDAVEKRIRNNEASAQELVYFLKRGSSVAQEEEEKLQAEIDVLKGKVKALEAATETHRLYQEAIEAFKGYEVDE